MAALTAPQRRALMIVHLNPGVTARDFGVTMWPEAEGHDRLHATGPSRAAVRGAPMWRQAGRFLAQLVKAGWLIRKEEGAPDYQPHWYITPLGRHVLARG